MKIFFQWLFLILTFLFISIPTWGRDASQVRRFRADHPCPVTGKSGGACPGWVVDHIIPLCAGGVDDPSNMIWQEKKESIEKDKTEWALCRWIHTMEERKAAEGDE